MSAVPAGDLMCPRVCPAGIGSQNPLGLLLHPSPRISPTYSKLPLARLSLAQKPVRNQSKPSVDPSWESQYLLVTSPSPFAVAAMSNALGLVQQFPSQTRPKSLHGRSAPALVLGWESQENSTSLGAWAQDGLCLDKLSFSGTFYLRNSPQLLSGGHYSACGGAAQLRGPCWPAQGENGPERGLEKGRGPP